jgi:hypothetical protein
VGVQIPRGVHSKVQEEGVQADTTASWQDVPQTSAADVEAKVYAWNDRKKRFSPRQINLAFESPSDKGWLTANEQGLAASRPT